MRTLKRSWLMVSCAALLALGAGAASARADSSDPLFVFHASQNEKPGGEFEGPCGLAVDSQGSFYVSDYYHHAIDVYTSSHAFVRQLGGEDPLDGPCALALDSSGSLYVNNFHRNVAKFSSSFLPGPVLDFEAHPTGVAVDPATNNLYIDDRTHIAVYDSTGVALPGIALGGSLEDGYGLAVSAFSATKGFLYVPDAGADTVKVYDPATDTENPVATIAGPPGGFTSLRDAAVAVDRLSGAIYVADNLQPEYAERPEARIDVFSSSGAYIGHLKNNILDALPPGLAVDNSATATQGRVYVTSGDTEGASIYAYPPGAAITGPGVCAPGGSCPAPAGEAGPAPGLPEPALAASAAVEVAAGAVSPGATAAPSSAATRPRHRAHRHAKHPRHKRSAR